MQTTVVAVAACTASLEMHQAPMCHRQITMALPAPHPFPPETMAIPRPCQMLAASERMMAHSMMVTLDTRLP